MEIEHVPSCYLELLQEYGILHPPPGPAVVVVTASSAFLNTVKEKKTLMKVFYINLSDSSLPQLD